MSGAWVPGSPIVQGIKDGPSYTYLCRFTNFGSTPVLNVEADLTVNIRDVIKDEKGMHSGDVLASHVVATPRTNLSAGDKNTFDFYVRNYSDKWAEVMIPKVARVQALGSTSWQTVQLIPPVLGGFGLTPFERKPLEPAH